MAFRNISYSLDIEMPAFLFLMRYIGVTQGQAQKIVAKGRLLVNGVRCSSSGQKICGDIVVQEFIPEPRGLAPIFTTPDFGLFDKPSGLLVHPKTHRTPYSLLDDIRHCYGKSANNIHRIDMETSGLLLVSRDKASERRLKMMFEERRVKKSYLAWVRGKLSEPFSVDAPILRNSDYSEIKLKMVVDPAGKPSLTHFSPLKYDEELDATLIRATPHTGRQHQIRLHLFHVKHPILGDPIYGVSTEAAISYLDRVMSSEERMKITGASRLMLHAEELDFEYRGARYRIRSNIEFEKEKREIALPSARFNPLDSLL
ncbi:putative ribosomal pseudouridine synthase [Hydrogenimonas sp.]|nr:putative ribosomal pseudouridine synthase [Hydrogenimonas sp.]